MKSTILCLISLTAFFYGTDSANKIYRYDEGDLTMLEEMDLALEIPYLKNDSKWGSAKMMVENATVDADGSSLNGTYAVLRLQFGELLVHNMTQTFESEGGNFYMEGISFEFLLDREIFKDAKDETSLTFTLSGQKLFSTSLGRSYACDADVTKQITKSKHVLNMTFANMRLQPFNVTDAKFSEGQHCSADPTAGPPENGTTSLTTGLPENGTTALLTTILPFTTSAPPENKTLNSLNVTDHKGNNCIMELIEATFVLKKKNSNSTTIKMMDAVVDQTKSHCGNKTKNESAVIFSTFGDLYASTLRQEFAVNGDKYYYLKDITLNLIETIGKESVNTSFEVPIKNNDTFQVPFGKSLKCDSKTTIEGTSKTYNVTMTFSKVRLQAFDIKNNSFSTQSECPADHTISNIVPIAVGCALAVLVIIVLVAYLIGRRNSSRAGYESV